MTTALVATLTALQAEAAQRAAKPSAGTAAAWKRQADALAAALREAQAPAAAPLTIAAKVRPLCEAALRYSHAWARADDQGVAAALTTLGMASRILVCKLSNEEWAMLAASSAAPAEPPSAPTTIEQLCPLLAFRREQCKLAPGHAGGCLPRGAVEEA